MPPPKSPLDKPSSCSSHSRRPSGSRRSSSEKSVTRSSKHGAKATQTSQGKPKESMPDLSPWDAMAPPESGLDRALAELGGGDGLGKQDNSRTLPDGPSEHPRTIAPAAPRDSGAGGRGVKFGPEGVDISKMNSAEELERLRAAMNTQLQLSQQREMRVRKSAMKGDQGGIASTTTTKSRVSPIHEEEAPSPSSLDEAFASPLPSATTSTESAATIREGFTPAAMSVRTPSYPFPSMKTPRHLSYNSHRPFTTLSPTVNPAPPSGEPLDRHVCDRVQSGPVTPASSLNFHPPAASPQVNDPNYQMPDLYDLSLRLVSEPGLDSWWTTVSDIMRDSYMAERVTLTIPADPTDVENVPWAQKATFNAIEEDELSLAYLPRGSSLVVSSTNEISNSDEGDSPPDFWPTLRAVRPGLQSRHSFTAYEDTKRETPPVPEEHRSTATRPAVLARAKSYVAGAPDMPLSSARRPSARPSLQSLRRHTEFEEMKSSVVWEDNEGAEREVRGRVFPVLQALDYEADPLIDNTGVMRVLEREKLVVLTRDYPYNQRPDSTDDKSNGSGTKSQRSGKSKESPPDKSKRGKTTDLSSRIQSFLGSKSKHAQRSSREPPVEAAKYEEYEQGSQSPWSQSPAPSPAVRSETDENPFFANAPVDEETFDPNPTSNDYSQASQVEAIGVDRSWTVLHLPLMHPLLSKAVHAFRLDAAAMESKSAARAKGVDTKAKPQEPEAIRERRTPIAILSLLSPVIPYPSSLRHSLEFLAPHLASSYSLCRHHSNLQTEIAGLSRKGPRQAGFGAVISGAPPVDERIALGHTCSSSIDENNIQRSSGGSITSPSDYSCVSRSAAGSPAVTPGWEPSSVGFSRDKRLSGGSPVYGAGESYFAPRVRPALGRVDTGSTNNSIVRARLPSKDPSPIEARSHQQSRMLEEKRGAPATPDTDLRSDLNLTKPENDESRSVTSILKHETAEPENASPARSHPEAPPRRQTSRGSKGPMAERTPHTQLHSYGADFSATFQSLPTTSGRGSSTTVVPGRSGSMPVPTEMPPPSDRVKGLMLDSLPAHVFVAMPPSGEIVWVNNRYLTYRGQTVQDLYHDPWASLHSDERDEYLKAWGHAIRSGEQFSKQVRIRRFDGSYRWFYTRAVGHRDHRGVIVQWYGTHMDIHDQHVAEVKAARQEEIEASEAKHRQLANLIPQITFAATEDDGITFANEQWLSYTGQSFDDALGLGFMDHIHPDDLAKCHIPVNQPPAPAPFTVRSKKRHETSRRPAQVSSGGKSKSSSASEAPNEITVKGVYPSLSRTNSSSSESIYEYPIADLAELARTGVIKITTDSDGRQSYETEVRLKSKTGDYRWHLVRCVEVENIALGSGDGSWFGACTDIHNHKLLEKTLKETMNVKTRFLSNMSHEIRTPLIGISGMVNFLQDTPLTDEQADYSNTIKSSADSLLNIINDILDLSKVDAGMMKLSFQWFHTRSLVEEVNEILCSLAITKRIELNYVVDVDVPEMVKGDKFRIRQVLLNIVGNAIKFTTVGEVFSRCRVSQNASINPNEIVLEYSIIDTGSGFTQEEAEMIFKPFSQIDGSSTRTHGGTGLGLVISRQLVELHGGKMEGSAVPGKGSTFTFTATFGLPTEEDHPATKSTPQRSKDIPISAALLNDRTVTRILKPEIMNMPLAAGQRLPSPIFGRPNNEPSIIASPATLSPGSSTPSVSSVQSHVTQMSSSSSIGQSLSNFSQATRIGSSKDNQMNLALPDRRSSSSSSINPPSSVVESDDSSRTVLPLADTELPRGSNASQMDTVPVKRSRPPMYSILIICPQRHSREATTQHIEMTLPKDVPHQIAARATVEEAQQLICGDDPVFFTHIVVNISSKEEIVTLINQTMSSTTSPDTSVVVLSDPVQRQEIFRIATAYDYDQLAKEHRLTFVFKPVKPSRFAVIFDPEKERDLSTDRNRFNAAQQVADQKQSYLEVTKRIGNKGLKVLLVEDNLVNQKVLLKFLSKVGIAVELALDGVECTKKVFSQDHSFYSLILCDLHMPNKDGYETCREIRQWEERESYPPMPIIALSANVMADVVDKCVQAGFNSYVTKPVDFKALSVTMGDLLDPNGSENASV
ncbi:ATPase of HSP90 chaperone topoisomerase II kinase [Venustampulla echinocandica]|uniref:histidine kinase n=1 Tax=Venustampulla echinocandica TaxID=2656787 RepID=A0A370U0I6_9HELO|nr:ATPase of HSP90 chaperone topoisomerase II kinase [Venustampulla echinocandica]RDL41285.1 ATPase of HSP90 chaperone topoisomerase II kinase [Venustampulla echinocandica]